MFGLYADARFARIAREKRTVALIESPHHQPLSLCDRRTAERQSVEVAAIVSVGARDYTAKVLNIVEGGAMIETAAPLLVSSAISVGCGSISTDAVVVWKKFGRVGVRFLVPLAYHQLTEQVLRSRALEARRTS